MWQLLEPVLEVSVEAWMAVSLGPLLVFSLIRDLKRLAPWSTAANAATLAGLAAILYYLGRGERAPDLRLWGDPAAFPLFFGTTLFALTAVGVVSALHALSIRTYSLIHPLQAARRRTLRLPVVALHSMRYECDWPLQLANLDFHFYYEYMVIMICLLGIVVEQTF